MVMSMDTSADQTMSSPQPFPVNDNPSPTPSANTSSASPFQQQGDVDDGHEDEHSKSSNQTVVAKQNLEQMMTQSSDDGLRESVTPSAERGLCGSLNDDDQQEQMIVSRGSSFDGDKKQEMNVDDESNEEPSVRANFRFEPTELDAKLSQAKSTGIVSAGITSNSKAEVQSFLVAQMRDIVEGSSVRNVAIDQHHQASANQEIQNQPKSSSESLNNQNDNNASKASLDSATAQKRTRHQRAHCRHHHNHHHHHRHRQSIGGPSMTEAQEDSGEVQLNPSSSANPHYQQHHRHRHSNTSHSRPHHHHHHHHNYPGHHHHYHNQDKNKGTSSKRSSIQKLPLTDAGQQEQQRHSKNESNSSMSSISLTRSGDQRGGNPNLTNVDSKSSATPSEEQNLHRDNHDSSNQKDTHQPHHHHHHHHHCHHRTHKKRLVLDAGNNQLAAVSKSSGDSFAVKDENSAENASQEDGSTPHRKPLLDSTSDMNVLESDRDRGKYSQHMHHHPHEHSHHHHHHHHPHHHHHHHHAHSVHCGDEQNSSNKELNDSSQQQQAPEGPQHPQHHHHHHHHRHHRHHHHHGHHCRHTRHRNRAKSGSKVNLSPRDSGKNIDEIGIEHGARDVTFERRLSSQSLMAKRCGDDGTVSVNIDTNIDQSENKSPLSKVDQSTHVEDVNMDMSPKIDGKPLLGIGDESKKTEVDASPIKGEGASPAELNSTATGPMDGAKDSEFGGESGTSRKHDSSCNFEPTRRSDRESSQSGDVGGNEREENNRLTRQMSSQSSKKSQKDSLRGSGRDRNQQDQLPNECTEPNLQAATANQQPIKAKQIIESSVTADRRCRLCWCCCCPCSALNVREVPERAVDKTKSASGPPSSPTSKYPTPPNVSLDEIRSWGESFDKLMKCTDGRKVFQDFLRCEYSEENILFWSACEELKKEKDSKSVAAKARDIYEDYISILSSKEVSLDSRVRDVINNNIKKPTSNIFDEAQLQIYTLMHRDSYPRFINSGMYKKLAQITTSNSRKSSS